MSGTDYDFNETDRPWMKVTGRYAGTGQYAWTEQYYDGSAFQDLPGGRVGTVNGLAGATATILPAVEMNGQVVTSFPWYVRAERAAEVASVGCVYEFALAAGAAAAPTVYAARVRHGSNQTIGAYVSVGEVEVVYDTTDSDAGGFFSLANAGRLTAPVDGVYVVGSQIQWLTAPGDAVFHLFIDWVHGGTGTRLAIDTHSVPKATAMTYSECAQSVTTLIAMSAGDYVKAVVANLDVNSNFLFAAAEYSPVFWIHKVN